MEKEVNKNEFSEEYFYEHLADAIIMSTLENIKMKRHFRHNRIDKIKRMKERRNKIW